MLERSLLRFHETTNERMSPWWPMDHHAIISLTKKNNDIVANFEIVIERKLSKTFIFNDEKHLNPLYVHSKSEFLSYYKKKDQIK